MMQNQYCELERAANLHHWDQDTFKAVRIQCSVASTNATNAPRISAAAKVWTISFGVSHQTPGHGRPICRHLHQLKSKDKEWCMTWSQQFILLKRILHVVCILILIHSPVLRAQSDESESQLTVTQQLQIWLQREQKSLLGYWVFIWLTRDDQQERALQQMRSGKSAMTVIVTNQHGNIAIKATKVTIQCAQEEAMSAQTGSNEDYQTFAQTQRETSETSTRICQSSCMRSLKKQWKKKYSSEISHAALIIHVLRV